LALSGKVMVKVKIWFENQEGEAIIGYGGYWLLKAIAESQSLTEASKKLNMSYGKVLKILRKMEKAYGRKIVNTARGGYGGGGKATLTGEAIILIESYSKILTQVMESIEMLGFKVGPLPPDRKLNGVLLNKTTTTTKTH